VGVLEPTVELNGTKGKEQPESPSVNTSVLTRCPPQVTLYHEYVDVSMITAKPAC
jgi:hypothetical protein